MMIDIFFNISYHVFWKMMLLQEKDTLPYYQSSKKKRR